jgi:hypothetical protein
VRQVSVKPCRHTSGGPEPPRWDGVKVEYRRRRLEDLQASMSSAEGQATVADIGTFATGGATVVIAEVD